MIHCMWVFQVGSILNFSLMYFLAPTKAAVAGAVVGGNLFQKLVSEQTLKNLGAPGMSLPFLPTLTSVLAQIFMVLRCVTLEFAADWVKIV